MFRPKEIVRLVPEPIMFKHDFFVTMKQRIMPVLHLTSSLAQKYDEKSREAFIGDGTCSLQNMELSCFASESCNQNRRNLTFQLKNLMNEDLSLIYVHNDTFLGCLSAHRTDASSALQILFPYLNPESGSVLVSNLCVSSASRGGSLQEAHGGDFKTFQHHIRFSATRDDTRFACQQIHEKQISESVDCVRKIEFQINSHLDELFFAHQKVGY